MEINHIVSVNQVNGTCCLQALYMFVAVLLSAFLHEAGHAVCALVEGVTLNGFGLFLMVLYPGAYVDLDTETLLSRSHLQQLRIYCAGVSYTRRLLFLAILVTPNMEID